MTLRSPSKDAAFERRSATLKPASTSAFPAKQGLYDPRNEHDACGVGFVAHMRGEKSHGIVKDGCSCSKTLPIVVPSAPIR